MPSNEHQAEGIEDESCRTTEWEDRKLSNGLCNGFSTGPDVVSGTGDGERRRSSSPASVVKWDLHSPDRDDDDWSKANGFTAFLLDRNGRVEPSSTCLLKPDQKSPVVYHKKEDDRLLDSQENAGGSWEMVAPDGGWGWMVLLGTVVVNTLIPGLIKSFGILFVEFLTVFKASPSSAAWIPGLTFALYNLLGPLASALSNRFSCRFTTVLGGLTAAVGLALSYFATSIEFLYLSYGLLGGIGAGLSYTPGILIVGRYFEKRRGLANGICMSGSALGSIILPPFLHFLLSHYSYRGAILIMCGVVLNVCVGAALYQPVEWHQKRRWVPNEIAKTDQDPATGLGDNIEKKSGIMVNGSALRERKVSWLPLWSLEEPVTGEVTAEEHQPSLLLNRLLEDTSAVNNGGIGLNDKDRVKTEVKESGMAKDLSVHKNELGSIEGDKNCKVAEAESNSNCNAEGPVEGKDIVLNHGSPAQSVPGDRSHVKAHGGIGDSGVKDGPRSRSLTPELILSSKDRGVFRSGVPTDTSIGDRDHAAHKNVPADLFPVAAAFGSRSTIGGTVERLKSDRDSNFLEANRDKTRSRSVAPESITGDKDRVPSRTVTGESLPATATFGSRSTIGGTADRLRRTISVTSTLSSSSFAYMSTSHLGSTAAAYQHTEVAQLGSVHELRGLETRRQVRRKCCCRMAKLFDVNLLRNAVFLLITYSYATSGIAYTNLLIILPAHAHSMGFVQGQYAMLLSIIASTDLTGRIGGAWISDLGLFPRKYFFITGLTLSGVVLGLMPLAKDFTQLMISCALFGLTSGVYIGLMAVLLMDHLGSERLASSFGLCLAMNGIVMLAGPPAIGIVREQIGSYQPVLYMLGVILISGGAIWLLEPCATRYEEQKEEKLKQTSVQV